VHTWIRAAGTIIAVALISAGEPGRPRAAEPPRATAVTAAGPRMERAAARVDAMLSAGTLVRRSLQADTMVPGRTHERLTQRHEGLPVYGAELIRQMNGGGVETVFGRMFDDVSLPTTTPSIGPDQAAMLAAGSAGDGAEAGAAELGIWPGPAAFVLAYRVPVRSNWNLRTCYVDASTGVVLDCVSRIRAQQSAVVGLGRGVLNDEKKVSATQATGAVQAIDQLRPAAGFTLDFKGNVPRLNAFLRTGEVSLSDVATSTGPAWTDGPTVDVHVYQGWVYDYYFKRFGRRGLDDRDLDVISIVHPIDRRDAPALSPEVVGLFVNNAVYLGDGFMLYGDGDGVEFDYLGGALDIVAHEMTHGVTEFTSGLGSRDEPGALNEAFSDIMATGAEFFFFRDVQGPQRGPNFLLAEDVTRFGPGYIRSMANPADNGYPAHYSQRRHIGTPVDDGGVHINATIPGHAFYLAVLGGTNRVSGMSVQGVGLANMERMERIFYRAFTFYLGPLAQFTDARAATLQAAADLYGAGSVEQVRLQQAWTAVGVE
jgi:thermolysin